MIPIIIKDFEWSQNATTVFIVVPVPRIKSENTDILTSPKYLKVHSAPFIFEVFLAHEVDDTVGECTIDEKSEKVSFRLKKLEDADNATEHAWVELEDKNLTKEEKIGIRAEAVELTQKRSDKEKEETQKRRFERKQATVHDQIRLDTEAKERITSVKNLETLKALQSIQSADDDKPENNQDIFTKDDVIAPEAEAITITSIIKGQHQENIKKKIEVEEISEVGIRPAVCISVSFTPRLFPTPARESAHAEEQEWLKKQAEARKLSGFVDEDLRPEEKNPEWLLEKGRSLLKKESYLGAISAFSLGIRLAPKMGELFMERAGAHLAIQNYHKSVDDSSQALELFTPKVSGNLVDRLKCHIGRGRAFWALDLFDEALADLKEAEILAPNLDTGKGDNEVAVAEKEKIQKELQEVESLLKKIMEKTEKKGKKD